MPQPNHLLAALPPGEMELLRSRLTPVYLSQHQVLCTAGERLKAVYFPVTAILSLVADLSDGGMVEAAMVGRDGVLGAAAALDGGIALSRMVVRLSGHALACDAALFKAAAQESRTLLSVVLRYEQTIFAQAQQLAACNSAHQVDARLCRWMLRARDLSGSDILPFTQEFLAEMLGVRRSSVSVAAHALQQAGLISYTRGRIQIIDLDRLRQNACECHGTVKAVHDRLLGQQAEEAKRLPQAASPVI